MTLRGPITLGKQPGRTIFRPVAIHVIQMTVALLVCLSGLGQAATSRAQEGVTVRPDPLSLEIGTGGTGTVDILVEDVTDLYALEFEITFDPTLVEVVDADPGKQGVQIEAGDFLSPDWLLNNTADNDNGTIAFALCQINPSPPQSGDGVLAIITWRSKGAGTSPLHFAHLLLAAPGGVEIPASAENGQIAVMSAQAPRANTRTPTPTATPTGTPNSLAPMSTLTATPIPPTSTPPATAVLEGTEPPAATPTPVPPSTATPTDVPAPTSTSLPTATPAREGTGTPPPTMIVIQPASTAVSVAAAQPEPTEEAASPTPSPPTPNRSSGSSGIPTSSLAYIAIACVVTALGAWAFAWVLWRRK